MSLGSPQIIAGLVCQELCLARMLQARRCSAGVLKDRKKEGVKGGSRNRMAEWGGHQAFFQLYKAQRGCPEEGMGEWRKMLPGPHVQAKEVDVTLRPSAGG